VEAVWVPLAVALIGGPVMWFLTRFDKRNTDQHAENQKVLTRIESKIEKVDDRLNDHITWHIDQK
jgi:sensor domain CHASE-containing protein